jgi:hypothetical protein
MTATAVYVTADLDVDRDGDEVLVHNVYVGDDDAEPVGTVYTVRRGLAAAVRLADKIRADRRLAEVVVEN